MWTFRSQVQNCPGECKVHQLVISVVVGPDRNCYLLCREAMVSGRDSQTSQMTKSSNLWDANSTGGWSMDRCQCEEMWEVQVEDKGSWPRKGWEFSWWTDDSNGDLGKSNLISPLTSITYSFHWIVQLSWSCWVDKISAYHITRYKHHTQPAVCTGDNGCHHSEKGAGALQSVSA